MAILSKNIDAHPYTGTRSVHGKLRIRANDPSLNGFFDGSPDYEQIAGVTPGKVYDVVLIEGVGDVEDVTIIDDFGQECVLADYFFEEVEGE